MAKKSKHMPKLTAAALQDVLPEHGNGFVMTDRKSFAYMVMTTDEHEMAFWHASFILKRIGAEAAVQHAREQAAGKVDREHWRRVLATMERMLGC